MAVAVTAAILSPRASAWPQPHICELSDSTVPTASINLGPQDRAVEVTQVLSQETPFLALTTSSSASVDLLLLNRYA